MTSIADSGAFRDPKRILPQHQAAITLLQAGLSSPRATNFSWLDLACGRGQIIASLKQNLSERARAKVHFFAYDLDQNYARETLRSAELLGFASVDSKVGDLSDFDELLPSDKLFEFITLTNTIHEVQPSNLASLLVHCIGRLSSTGTLFVYDMETISPSELGAVTWTRPEIEEIVTTVLSGLNSRGYCPEVGQWTHKSCNGWSIQLQRQHLSISAEKFNENRENAVYEGKKTIGRLLSERVEECRSTLETLTLFGPETTEEEDAKERLLYEFWALSRAQQDDQ